jgi:exodeoxyribonuclease VII small subunit
MTNLSFEKALADLEGIVAKLEKGGIALNESLSLFEKGVKLARYLRGELDKAERKVEILLKDEKGNVRAEDFDLEDDETEPGPRRRSRAASGTKEEDEEESPEEKKPEDSGNEGGELF